jgi:rod shape determining protein RodA
MDSIYKYIRETDMLLLALCLISTIYGVILIDSATRHMESSSNVYIQVVALFIGVCLYVLFSLLDIDTIADRSKILYVLSLAFISTLFIWGKEVSGNKAWLDFGAFDIQPAEVVKIPYIIILAKLVSGLKDRRVLNTPLSFLKIIGMFSGLFVFIMASSQDLGSALVYLFILAVVLFVGGVDLKWLLIGAVVLVGVLLLAWNSGLISDIQKDRIKAPYDPTVDPTGLNVRWQANKSKYAIAAGDFLGQGLYNGTMTQSGAVPKQHTDFIFAVAAEELGFIGGLLIVALLVAIIVRTIFVGIRSNNNIGMLVCTGIAALLICQMFENIGMCLGLTPVIGLTLPFFSYGGSSIVTLFAAMGIVSGIKMRPKPARFRSFDR